MTLKQLEILLALARTGSFHGAAEAVHLTQPAISHQIKSLEEELGETLIIRSRPTVTLLPRAKLLLEAAERILGEIDDIKAVFWPQRLEDITGNLRLGASSLGISYLYSDYILGFINIYPKISLMVTVTESGLDAAQQVEDGFLDIALTPEPTHLSGLRFVKLGVAHHVAIVAGQHPLFDGSSTINAKQLQKYPFIRYRARAGSRRFTDELFLNNGGYPSILMETNDTELIKRVVATGAAAAVVPAFTIRTMGAYSYDKLARLELIGVDTSEEYGVAYREDVTIRTRDLFIDLSRNL